MPHSSGSQSLYDVSFKLYRLSPLYCPSSVSLLLSETLLAHSRRFTEILDGDVLRGVYVGLGGSSEASSASGALKACRWTLLDPTAAFSAGAEDQRSAFPGLEGIKVDAQYEKTTYTALLVRKSDSTNSRAAGPINLPLLMTHMPPALRETLIAYIGTTFDTRIEPMRLSSVFMGDMLEVYLEGIMQAGNEYFEKIMKGIQLVLGFRKEVVPDLKSFSIDIRKEEVRGFMEQGRALLTQSPLGDSASRRASENGEVGKHPKRPSPFMAAMKRYFTEQTSLNIEHRDVYLSKLSCGGFVLTADGSVRFLVPPSIALREDGLPQSQTPQSTITSIVEAFLAEASARPAQLSV